MVNAMFFVWIHQTVWQEKHFRRWLIYLLDFYQVCVLLFCIWFLYRLLVNWSFDDNMIPSTLLVSTFAIYISSTDLFLLLLFAFHNLYRMNIFFIIIDFKRFRTFVVKSEGWIGLFWGVHKSYKSLLYELHKTERRNKWVSLTLSLKCLCKHAYLIFKVSAIIILSFLSII